MDLSSNRSQDEDRIMQRQLYRAGQNPSAQTPASGPAKPAVSPAAKPKSPSSSSGKSSSGKSILTPSQRRKILIGLGVALWLLFLGGISYCLCLPDLEALSRELNQERMAIFQDKDLSPEQFREKMDQIREKEKNLTPSERKQMWEMSRKERTRKGNKDMYDFLKLSPEEQVAQLKKQAAEWEARRAQFRKMFANKGGQNGNRGGGGPGGGRGGPGGGGPGGGWGGGGGGGSGNAGADFSKSQDSRSPEARAGGMYKMGLMQQNGIGFGGRGGPGGGKGR